jgi:hypothetical protein
MGLSGFVWVCLGLSGFVWVWAGAEPTTKSPNHLSSSMTNCLAHTVKVHPSGEGSRAHRKSFDLRSGWRANPRKDNRSHQFESVVNDLIETIVIRARWPSITPVSGASGAGVVRKELHATFSQIARSL